MRSILAGLITVAVLALLVGPSTEAYPPDPCEIDPVSEDCVQIEPCAIVPGEVTGVQFRRGAELIWDPTPSACSLDYNVYRGTISWLPAGTAAKCHGDEIQQTWFRTAPEPDAGEAFFYLVTAEADHEGTPGSDSSDARRPLLGRCDNVMRAHVLDRVSYGWSEWSADRIAALGLRGYINEQLDPTSISEASNTELTLRTADLIPPETIQELQALDLVNAVYARRQLEQQMALFWANHFNTEYRKSNDFFFFLQQIDPDRRKREATTLHYEELEIFRDLAFNGTFREILEASATSPAMIIYLDTNDNRVGTPNENYARELLELHTMGVDNGYDQEDIEALAKVFTGWNTCKKETANMGDLLAPCVPQEVIGTPQEPEGAWVPNFVPGQHDCTQKILFEDTDHETVIPNTCGNPDEGVNDAFLALDGIVDHPATAEYVSYKLLRKFATEEPTQQAIDHVVAAWQTAVDPGDYGDLDRVLRAVMAQADLVSPDSIGNKIKTPFEQVASALRAVRGQTNGSSSVRSYLERMIHLLHENPIPTGYSEVGGSWIDTNNTLERQNFGADMATRTGYNFGADVIGLLQDNGVSTASGNAARIVEFLSQVMFGGALTPGEVGAAVLFLETDDFGNDSDYDNARIRELAGFLLGYAQFQEQ